MSRLTPAGLILSLVIAAAAFVSALFLSAAISSGHWRSVAAIAAVDVVGALFVAWWCLLRPALNQRRAAAETAKAAVDAAALADCKREAREW